MEREGIAEVGWLHRKFILNKQYTCDCGKFYVPNEKYGDNRVKCNGCIKITRSAEMKKKCVEYLGGSCADCKNTFHPVCMDFDHRFPKEKQFKISGNYIFRWKELRKELDKTTLRCSNCHRLRHWLDSGLDK